MNHRALLTRCLAGDTGALEDMSTWTHADLVAAADVGPVEVSAGAVATVLSGYLDGRVPDSAAQAWASLVRRGHLEQVERMPIRPIVIDYQHAREDAIVEAIARLDELGDIVDGQIDAAEGQQLLAALA